MKKNDLTQITKVEKKRRDDYDALQNEGTYCALNFAYLSPYQMNHIDFDFVTNKSLFGDDEEINRSSKWGWHMGSSH